MTNLIFDYDGTLHDCIKIYSPAFRYAYAHLVSLGLAENKEWTDSEISKWLGFNSKDMWDSFMPDLPLNRKDECSVIIAEAMLRFVREGKAGLYPRAAEILRQLKDSGYTLIFLSNCKHQYMQAHIKQFHLDDYFSAFYCTENYDFKPKYEIFSIVKQVYHGEHIIIGDRFQDLQVAQKHGLKSVGCAYGYGEERELRDATISIVQISDIIDSLTMI